jgi:hypothetical protein
MFMVVFVDAGQPVLSAGVTASHDASSALPAHPQKTKFQVNLNDMAFADEC